VSTFAPADQGEIGTLREWHGWSCSQGVRRSVPSRQAQAQYPNREPCAAYFACTRRGWAWGRNHSVGYVNSALYIARCPHNAWAKTASRTPICRMRQAARASALCSRLLRIACGTCAWTVAGHASVGAQGERSGEEKSA